MLTPSPRLDTAYLAMSACAIIQTVFAVYYCHKARTYKKLLDKYQPKNASASLSKPYISPTDTTKKANTLKGGGKL